jgi:hypothetical protein
MHRTASAVTDEGGKTATEGGPSIYEALLCASTVGHRLMMHWQGLDTVTISRQWGRGRSSGLPVKSRATDEGFCAGASKNAEGRRGGKK